MCWKRGDAFYRRVGVPRVKGGKAQGGKKGWTLSTCIFFQCMGYGMKRSLDERSIVRWLIGRATFRLIEYFLTYRYLTYPIFIFISISIRVPVRQAEFSSEPRNQPLYLCIYLSISERIMARRGKLPCERNSVRHFPTGSMRLLRWPYVQRDIPYRICLKLRGLKYQIGSFISRCWLIPEVSAIYYLFIAKYCQLAIKEI